MVGFLLELVSDSALFGSVIPSLKPWTTGLKPVIGQPRTHIFCLSTRTRTSPLTLLAQLLNRMTLEQEQYDEQEKY